MPMTIAAVTHPGIFTSSPPISTCAIVLPSFRFELILSFLLKRVNQSTMCNTLPSYDNVRRLYDQLPICVDG